MGAAESKASYAAVTRRWATEWATRMAEWAAREGGDARGLVGGEVERGEVCVCQKKKKKKPVRTDEPTPGHPGAILW
eukprot:3467062-Prymnesium_polylepis.1